MRRPLKVSDVRPEDYDAIYLPGGHGPMQDLAFDADAGRLLTAQLASGNPLIHRVPRRPSRDAGHPGSTGSRPFKGYRVTGFTNQGGGGRRPGPQGDLAARRTDLLLGKGLGVDFSSGEIWKPYMVERTGEIWSPGRTPPPAAVLAKRLLEGLSVSAASREIRAEELALAVQSLSRGA